MTYQEALEYLYSSLPAFHRQGAGAYKPGLGTALALDRLTGFPHRRYPTIHIAGTNGKGSTAHTLAAILQSAGYRTGLYTSPHIFDFGERIRVDGEMIAQAEVVRFTEWWREVAPSYPDLQPSFFELTSAMAFEYFARQEVDIAVIETGLGGRLDSTNIITPILSVITNISLDHTAFLGDTRAAIASEKAGIIKPGIPVVIGEADSETLPVYSRKAEAEHAPLVVAQQIEALPSPGGGIDYPDTPFGPLHGELEGAFQPANTATVLAAVGQLRRSGLDIPDRAVAHGLANVTALTHLTGRWMRIASSPTTIIDTGHNEGGWRMIARQLNSEPAADKWLIIGFVADKDLSHIFESIRSLHGRVNVIFCTPSTPRALAAADLAEKAAGAGIPGTVIPDVNRALAHARANCPADGLILIAGSNFLIAGLK